MKKFLFMLVVLSVCLAVSIPIAGSVAAADPVPDLPSGMPPGTGIFGTFYFIYKTGPAYPSSGYHWDDLATPGDDRVIPEHYAKDAGGIHVVSPMGTAAANALDFNWVWVGSIGNYVIWDFGAPIWGVRVYPAQDHGPYLNVEFAEFDVLASNNPATSVSTWYGAVQTALYYDDINNVQTHDGVIDYSFGGNSFRYVAVRTNALGSGDFEIDALEALEPPPPVEKRIVAGPTEVNMGQLVTWDFLYTISNPYDFTMQNVVVKDNFGANLEVTGVSETLTPIDIQGVANRVQNNPSPTPPAQQDPFGAGWPSYFDATTGLQDLGGIEFNIGDKIIILHGGTGGAGANVFPTSVNIPVNVNASKLYFLGNVAGWGNSGLSGIGSYRINYLGGTFDTILLTRGVNIDEWLVSGSAHSSTGTVKVIEGFCRGSYHAPLPHQETWHLDLLIYEIGATKTVTSIDFIDAGTVAAPVLFALTAAVPSNDPAPSQGTINLFKRGSGRSTQWRFEWTVGNLAPGETATLHLLVSTGKNPAGKQEFTSSGTHILNSGATSKWINSVTGLQESETSGTIEVWVNP